jgi:hypothetical protein
MFKKLKLRLMLRRLRFAAFTRCPCGAGIAYDPSNYPKVQHWDCAYIMLGIADPKVKHTALLPFVFYEVKSECQPSAGGCTTRPSFEEVLKLFTARISTGNGDAKVNPKGDGN